MDLQPPVWGDDDEPDVSDAFGEHNIDYWVWSGRKLVPASPEQAALLREREARLRLERWRSVQKRVRPAAERSWRLRVVTRLARVLRFRPAIALPGLPRGRSTRPAGLSVPAREPDPTGGQTQTQTQTQPAPKS